jgi:site-specific DNA-cytosine methylase
VIDGRHFLPQHRERIVLVGFRRDLQLHEGFTLRDIAALYPAVRPTFGELLEPTVDAKFILTPVLWKYLYRYARKHQARGNGFGYGLVDPGNPTAWLEHSLPATIKTVPKFSSTAAGTGRWASSILTIHRTNSGGLAG